MSALYPFLSNGMQRLESIRIQYFALSHWPYAPFLSVPLFGERERGVVYEMLSSGARCVRDGLSFLTLTSNIISRFFRSYEKMKIDY